MYVSTLIRKLKLVAAEAMSQTRKERVSRMTPMGVRVHLQYKGEGMPPEVVSSAGRAVIGALEGVCYVQSRQVVQLLVTKGMGECNGMAITIWEVQ